MPRPKKGSPEAKAIGERLKAARAAKKTAEQIRTPEIDQNDVSALLKRIQELEQKQFFAPTAPVSTTRTVITKYSFNPKDYPDPRDRFFEESKLRLKGFTRDWFDLGWEVAKVNYEEDGQKMVAPRFELELYKIMEDEETGEPTNKRYTICRGLFFEDPDSFVSIANQHGLNVPESLHNEFLDEMRYLMMRDWLLEAFYPPRSTQAKKNKKEVVIGNRLVEVFEINSENSETMPFSQLTKKL